MEVAYQWFQGGLVIVMIELGHTISETKFDKPLKLDTTVKYSSMSQIEIESEPKIRCRVQIYLDEMFRWSYETYELK